MTELPGVEDFGPTLPPWVQLGLGVILVLLMAFRWWILGPVSRQASREHGFYIPDPPLVVEVLRIIFACMIVASILFFNFYSW
ncbi:MAG: hypothetical protein JW941_02240 [Candidatus Coatesbacteria bacterium]|nr:hypothetical protein [Candidatus Coatesbacteria bacterium]